MKRIIFIFILLLFILLAIGFYYRYEKVDDKDHLLLFGNVDVRQVDLGFRVSGRLNALYFEEGDWVPKGALVGILDKQPYEDEVKQAAAGVESIKKTYLNAEKVLKRRQDLIGEGGVTQEDLDNALSNKEVLLANLLQAEATLSIAKTNLEFTEVYSPSEGTILTRIREPGSIVNLATPICTLSIIHPIWIRAYVNEKELGLIYPGMEAEVTNDSHPDKVYKGRIGFISPQAEFTPKSVETTQLRTDLVYRIRIYIDNADRFLLQGMPVTVKLHLSKDDM